MTIGTVIKQLRIQHDVSQTQAAVYLGVTKQCVSNWEHGRITPSVEMLPKIADLFGVTVDCLLDREKNTVLAVEGLTEAQVALLHQLVLSFRAANDK